MNQAAVEIQGLSKVYRTNKANISALENLDLAISRGEIFGLLGPNGAGKTTTVRLICGLIPPTAGSILVDGLSVRDHPSQVRSRIGLLPEDAGDYKNLTLAEELEYHGAMYGLDAAKVRQRAGPLLQKLGLHDRAHHRLKTFSRGMRRKFHLIRALLHQPRLLLLDEPTAGLDPAIVEEVWDLLKALASEHAVTVILCSHHLEEVERLCGRVAILRRTLLAQGTLEQLSGSDRQFQLTLVDIAPAYIQAIEQTPGARLLGVEHATIRFAVDGQIEQVVPQLVGRVVAGGGRVVGLTRLGRDLRSLYRSFVSNGDAQSRGNRHE